MNNPGNFADNQAIKRKLGKKPELPASFYDTKGHLYVDCSECERGGNGGDKDKCSPGWEVKRPHIGGCFAGNIIPGVLEEISKTQGAER